MHDFDWFLLISDTENDDGQTTLRLFYFQMGSDMQARGNDRRLPDVHMWTSLLTFDFWFCCLVLSVGVM